MVLIWPLKDTQQHSHMLSYGKAEPKPEPVKTSNETNKTSQNHKPVLRKLHRIMYQFIMFSDMSITSDVPACGTASAVLATMLMSYIYLSPK